MHELACEEMVVIVCESGVTDEVLVDLKENGITHFTVHQGFLGVGETGRRENTPIWPGTLSVIFSCVPADQVTSMIEALRVLRDRRGEHSVGLKVFALPVRTLL